jgi:hypothetical protein
MTQPPNNALKLPFSVLSIILSAYLIILGAAQGKWLLCVAGAVLLILGCAQFRAIRQGRNPWWNRAPIDYQRDPNKKRKSR